jgi:hypothetical protein
MTARSSAPNASETEADMDAHIFEWFNDRYPDEMALCIAAFQHDRAEDKGDVS